MEPAVPNGAATEAQVPAESAIREQDRLMPFANVIRIMRRVLPPHAKISDDAKEMIQECVSEFISFVTGEANDRCHSEHRKTVTAEDLVWALNRLGFDNYVMPLSVYLRRMRESEGGGRGPARPDPTGPRAPQAPAPPEAALHGVQVQMQQAMYAPPAPAQAYTVAMPLPAIAPHPHVSGQYELFGGERSMAAYYGGGAYVSGSIRGDSADEASSLNAAPAPAMGTGSQSQ